MSMTDKEMYEMLIAKSKNIKMHMIPSDVSDIAERFKELSDGKSGKWIETQYKTDWSNVIRLECSVCGEKFTVSESAREYERYCKNCGARMDGELWGKNED